MINGCRLLRNDKIWAKEKGVHKGYTQNKEKGTRKKRVQEDKREKVLTLAAVGQSQRAISRDTGVSLTTVNKIVNTDADKLEQYRTQKKFACSKIKVKT